MKLPFPNAFGADKLCEGNTSCLFDVKATGELDIGRMTNEVLQYYAKLQQLYKPGIIVDL